MNVLAPQSKAHVFTGDLDRIQELRRWYRKPNQAALIHHLLNKAEEEKKAAEALKSAGGPA